jgi:hypothetical protein
MKSEYLMNIASSFFFICYIPEFYANYKNKNANIYNVFEKIVMLGGSGCALGYAVKTSNNALLINYAPLFVLDSIALFMRAYYAYKNRNRDVSIKSFHDSLETENPLHIIDENL